jgi:hypothetical protein
MNQTKLYEQCFVQPTYTISPEIFKDDEAAFINNYYRAYKLNNGDMFWFNDKLIEASFDTSVKHLTLGKEVLPGVVCIEKTKRRYWWQFWKKKYTGARFMYLEKEKTNE